MKFLRTAYRQQQLLSLCCVKTGFYSLRILLRLLCILWSHSSKEVKKC